MGEDFKEVAETCDRLEKTAEKKESPKNRFTKKETACAIMRGLKGIPVFCITPVYNSCMAWSGAGKRENMHRMLSYKEKSLHIHCLFSHLWPIHTYQFETDIFVYLCC